MILARSSTEATGKTPLLASLVQNKGVKGLLSAPDLTFDCVPSSSRRALDFLLGWVVVLTPSSSDAALCHLEPLLPRWGSHLWVLMPPRLHTFWAVYQTWAGALALLVVSPGVYQASLDEPVYQQRGGRSLNSVPGTREIHRRALKHPTALSISSWAAGPLLLFSNSYLV